MSHTMIMELELVKKFRIMMLQVEFEVYFIRCSHLTISSDFFFV